MQPPKQTDETGCAANQFAKMLPHQGGSRTMVIRKFEFSRRRQRCYRRSRADVV